MLKLVLRTHWTVVVAGVTFSLAILAGALATSGRSPTSTVNGSAADRATLIAVSDPKDPTPDTKGRATVAEEKTHSDCAWQIVNSHALAPLNTYESIEVQAARDGALVKTMIASCLAANGVDMVEVDRRARQQRADGYKWDGYAMTRSPGTRDAPAVQVGG